MVILEDKEIICLKGPLAMLIPIIMYPLNCVYERINMGDFNFNFNFYNKIIIYIISISIYDPI